MYSGAYTTPSSENSPKFFIDMYLLARRYRRQDAAYMYEIHCREMLRREPFTEEYFSAVTALCGPTSSIFEDTALSYMVFKELYARIEHMNNTDREIFRAKFEEGSLFNAAFLRRFGTRMLYSYQRLYDSVDSTYR
jgi:hypothetical protein